MHQLCLVQHYVYLIHVVPMPCFLWFNPQILFSKSTYLSYSNLLHVYLLLAISELISHLLLYFSLTLLQCIGYTLSVKFTMTFSISWKRCF